MAPCPTFTLELSIISKWFAKHIFTNLSFKITLRKTHVYIEVRWSWILKQFFYLGISNDDRTKIIVLPLFQLAKRLNSQNRNETQFINENWHKIYIWILVLPIGINEASTARKWLFYIISVPYKITDIQVPETL